MWEGISDDSSRVSVGLTCFVTSGLRQIPTQCEKVKFALFLCPKPKNYGTFIKDNA